MTAGGTQSTGKLKRCYPIFPDYWPQLVKFIVCGFNPSPGREGAVVTGSVLMARLNVVMKDPAVINDPG